MIKKDQSTQTKENSSRIQEWVASQDDLNARKNIGCSSTKLLTKTKQATKTKKLTWIK